MKQRASVYKFPSMIDPAERYPVGSFEWAHRMAARLQAASKSVDQHTATQLRRLILEINDATRTDLLRDNITKLRGPDGRQGGGTSASYTLRRLLRERPDLVARIESGELSANKAAIEAGFRKRATAFETIVKLLPKLTAAEKRKLKKLL